MKFRDLFDKGKKKTPENLQRIISLEREIYDGTTYMGMQNCRTWDDIARYCECSDEELNILVRKNWYVLIAKHEDFIEIVDFASKRGRMDIFEALAYIKDFHMPMSLDARGDTSYRLIKALERHGKISISHDESYIWGGETFHEMVISIGRDINLEIPEEYQQQLRG